MQTTPQLLRRPQVLALAGFKTTTLYELIKRGEFPPPVRIGNTAMVAWPADDVTNWIKEQIQNRPSRQEGNAA